MVARDAVASVLGLCSATILAAGISNLHDYLERLKALDDEEKEKEKEQILAKALETCRLGGE